MDGIPLTELGADEASAQATESDKGIIVKLCVYTSCVICHAYIQPLNALEAM